MSSAKTNLIRTTCQKAAATYRRFHGTMGRLQVNPQSAADEFAKAHISLRQIVVMELKKTETPVIEVGQPLPAEGSYWLVEALSGHSNFLHGRLPVSLNIGFVENGELSLGAVYFPAEDVLVLAQTGSGSSGPERLRVSGRTTLANAMLATPLNSADIQTYKLLDLAVAHNAHLRKTGHPLFDMIDVAAGRADATIQCRLNPLEAALGALIVLEAGGFITDLKGKPVTLQTTEIVAANGKLHGVLLKELNAK